MNKLFIKINTREHGAKEKVFGFFFSSVFLLAVLFLFIFSSFAFTTEAAINKQINYQGKLTDALNVAVPNGSYNMEFKLYDSVSSVLWTETRTGSSRVQVTSGLFSVMLGDVSSLASVDFNQTLYLGVNIGGTDVSPTWDGEMTPRKKLGAVPAAVESERVGGFTPSQTPVGNNIPVLTDGALTMTGGINSGSINSSNYITTNNSPIPSWGGDGSIYAAGVSGQGIMMGVQIPDTPNSWGGHTIGYIGTTNPKWFIGISKYNSDQNTLVYAEDSLAAQVRFAITPGGYVGIGTKTPTARLQITAGSSAEGNAPLKFTSGTNLGTPEAGAMEYDGTNLYFTPSGTTRETVAYQSDLTGGYVPYTGATDDLNLGVNNLTVDTNTLFVDSSNHRLGIGTTTPDSKIEFYGTNNQTTANMTDAGSRLSNIALNSDSSDSGSGAAITFGNVQSKSAGSLGWAAIKAFLQDGTANTKGDLAFSTRNSVSDTELTERMRISASGNIGIGTTNPGYLLSLKNATNPSMSFETTNYRYQVGTIEDDGMFHIKRNDGLVADRMIIDVNGNIGIGTTTPTYKLEVNGPSATDGIRTTGGLDFNLVDDPTAPTLALINTPGNVDAGTHTYYVSYLTDTGETHATRQTVAITTDASNGQVTVTIPVSSDGRVTGRKLYRTKAGASYWNPYYLATIPNNTDTTYIDNISDASLTGSAGVGIYRANTTNNLLTIEGAKSMLIDSNATFMGFGTGSANPSAGNLLFVGNYAGQNLTSGYATTFLGSYAGQSTTTGVSNSFVGAYAGTANTTGGSNSYLGTYAGTNNQTGVNNVAVGAQALQGVGGNSFSNNTAVGAYSLTLNTTGGSNSVLGRDALYANTTGSNNIAIGYQAGRYQSNGTTALTDAENSVYLGYGTRGKDNTDSNSIVVGYNAIGQGANTAVWGNTNITQHYFSGAMSIGSTSPQATLSIGNSNSGSQRLLYLGEPGFPAGSGGSAYGLSLYGNSSDGVFKFYGMNSGVETTNPILSMDRSNGNVGIGTPSPSSKLTVFGGNIANYTGFSNVVGFKMMEDLTGGNAALRFYSPTGGNPNTQIFQIINNRNRLDFGYAAKNRDTEVTSDFSTSLSINNNSNVGIGTINPNTKLDIKLDTDQHVNFFSNSGMGSIGSVNDAGSSYSPLGFYANSYYFGLGNVGIGTTTPYSALNVAGNGTNISGKGIIVGTVGDNINTAVPLNSEVGRFEIGFPGWRDMETTQIGAKIAGIRMNYYQDNNALVQATELGFFTGSGNTGGSGFHDTSVEAMRIDKNGNVGIGTTSPGAKLDVSGNAQITGNLMTPKVIGGVLTTSSLVFQTTTASGATGANIKFLVGNNGATEAMTILNDGKVGINNPAPTEALDVDGNIETTGSIKFTNGFLFEQVAGSVTVKKGADAIMIFDEL